MNARPARKVEKAPQLNRVSRDDVRHMVQANRRVGVATSQFRNMQQGIVIHLRGIPQQRANDEVLSRCNLPHPVHFGCIQPITGHEAADAEPLHALGFTVPHRRFRSGRAFADRSNDREYPRFAPRHIGQISAIEPEILDMLDQNDPADAAGLLALEQ